MLPITEKIGFLQTFAAGLLQTCCRSAANICRLDKDIGAYLLQTCSEHLTMQIRFAADLLRTPQIPHLE